MGVLKLEDFQHLAPQMRPPQVRIVPHFNDFTDEPIDPTDIAQAYAL